MRRTRQRRELAAALAFLVGGCGEPVAPPEPVVRPVRTVVVRDDGGELERTFAGQARAGEESRLSFRVGGLLRSLPVNVGDRVRAGELVAALDPTDLQLQLQEVQASLAQARSQERNAAAAYRRTRALYENENASRQALDSARAQADSARLQARSIAQNLALLRRQVGYARLEAPADGTIATVDVELNENVQPGQAVATLLAGERLEVEVSLPESLIQRVERGQEVEVRFTAIDLTVPGTVSEVGVASAGSATYPVAVELGDGAGERVRAGMAADVRFRFEGRAGDAGIRLPTHAVGEDRAGRFVYVVEATGPGLGVVRRRAVELGSIADEGVEIVDGLAGGERVVTAGVARIRDGLEVKLDPAQAAAPTTDDAPTEGGGADDATGDTAGAGDAPASDEGG